MKSGDMLAVQLKEAEACKVVPAAEAEPDHAKTGGYSAEEFPGSAALLDGHWKLHRDPNKSGAAYKLFDLTSDPIEKIDVSAHNAERLATMKKQLADWQSSVIDSLNGKDYR